jgi:hypothetical protein
MEKWDNKWITYVYEQFRRNKKKNPSIELKKYVI